MDIGHVDEDGPIPWRWRNLLHWQGRNVDYQWKIHWALESVVRWLRVIAFLLLCLIVVVYLK